MTNETAFTGRHSETGFTGRSVTSFRAEVAQMGRNQSALEGTSPATYTRSDMPVSREFLAYQQQRQGRAIASGFYDHATGAGLAVQGAHSEVDPTAYLGAHGFYAANTQGEEVAISPRQARGLVGRYLDNLRRGGNETVSFRDDSQPPARATVYLRSR